MYSDLKLWRIMALVTVPSHKITLTVGKKRVSVIVQYLLHFRNHKH